MTDRVPVTLGDVQETLLIPLYARAVETRRKRPMLRDPRAVEMVEAIDYDFTRFNQPPTLLGCVLRTAVIDGWVRDFLAEHPAGTVVEIGAGLNTRFERVDNGALHWIDLDLPDAIDLRRRFFTDSGRQHMLAGSILDPAWIDAVKQSPPPYFFAIEAVLMYLAETDVRRALGLIGEHFPGAHVALDTGGRFMVDRQHRHPTMKFMAARMRWSCDDPRDLESWNVGLQLRTSWTYTQAPRQLRQRLPLPYRHLLPALRILVPPFITTYRLNLYTIRAPHHRS
jgi:O-methyltransferase involved in polyketide biosynthesis